MKTRMFKLILEAIQTLCLVAVTAAVVRFLYELAPMLITMN